jgi:hypothetical protein
LCGVGGRTIAEAKRNLSCEEFAQWVSYRELRGSFHLGMRMEESTARWQANFFTFHAKQKKFNVVDFMPHYEKPDSEISLSDAMEQWR